MCISKTATCLPLVLFWLPVAAESRGTMIPMAIMSPLNPTPAQRMHTDPGAAYDEYNNEYGADSDYLDDRQRYETTVTTTYDQNGNRIMRDCVTENTYSIPTRIFLPHGLCRVCFVNRRL